MRYRVLILTGDRLFGRMLQLEFEGWHLPVGLSECWGAADEADVMIVDLDSADVPPEESYGYLVGFSRFPAVSADADARRCAMILRRPFRMSLLRREVLAGLRGIPDGRPHQPVVVPLRLEGGALVCGGERVDLTPTESRLAEALLSAGGETVSRGTLEALLEASGRGVLEVYICTVRKKIRQICPGAALECVRGVGYRLIPDVKNAKTT